MIIENNVFINFSLATLQQSIFNIIEYYHKTVTHFEIFHLLLKNLNKC